MINWLLNKLARKPSPEAERILNSRTGEELKAAIEAYNAYVHAERKRRGLPQLSTWEDKSK